MIIIKRDSEDADSTLALRAAPQCYLRPFLPALYTPGIYPTSIDVFCTSVILRSAILSTHVQPPELDWHSWEYWDRGRSHCQRAENIERRENTIQCTSSLY